MAEFSLASGPVDVTVLLPAYNEVAAIESVIREVRDALKGWDGTWEIMVVDDGSTDGTAEIARALEVRVVRRTFTGGSGAARKTGIRVARGLLIAMLDADGTYVAHELPKLLSYFPEFDQVNGARTSEQGTLKLLRIPAKWVLRKLAEAISGHRIPDLNTGMKVFKRDVMLDYLWVLPPGFSCVTSMTLSFLCNDRPVKYVSVPYRARIGRSKFRPLQDTAKYALTVIRLVCCFRPLRVFLPVALALFALAIPKSIYDTLFSPAGLQDSDVTLLIGGLLVFFVGILTDLIVSQRNNVPEHARAGEAIGDRPSLPEGQYRDWHSRELPSQVARTEVEICGVAIARPDSPRTGRLATEAKSVARA